MYVQWLSLTARLTLTLKVASERGVDVDVDSAGTVRSIAYRSDVCSQNIQAGYHIGEEPDER